MTLYALGDERPRIHPDAYIHPEAVLIGEVRLGPASSVWPGVVIRADNGPIIIGARTSVQDGAVIHTQLVRQTTDRRRLRDRAPGAPGGLPPGGSGARWFRRRRPRGRRLPLRLPGGGGGRRASRDRGAGRCHGASGCRPAFGRTVSSVPSQWRSTRDAYSTRHLPQHRDGSYEVSLAECLESRRRAGPGTCSCLIAPAFQPRCRDVGPCRDHPTSVFSC